MHYLHGLKQLHVVLIPSSSFHLMIQLQNDFIFKLTKKEKSKHWAAIHRSTHFSKASKMYLCIIMSHIPKGEMLGIFWSGLLAGLKAWTQIFTKLPLHWAGGTQAQSLWQLQTVFVLMETTAPCSEGRKELLQGSDRSLTHQEEHYWRPTLK